MKFFRFYFLDLAWRQTGFILSRKANGFTLIELMVVMGIMTIISVMSFAGYPALRQKMSLKRTSEEVALIVRQAQAYALGIKRTSSGSDDYFGFGVHFDKSAANQKSVILFNDLNDNKTYNTTPINELFQKFKIDTGDIISDLQVWRCTTSCSGTNVNILDIVYPRAVSMATINNNNLSYAVVMIKSPNVDVGTKLINIWTSGQISVK